MIQSGHTDGNNIVGNGSNFVAESGQLLEHL